MSYLKNSLLLISILLVAVGLVFFLAWLNVAKFIRHSDLITALETTTATFGTLLGIITAGLMFTQGKFSELASELTDKAPDYLAEVLSLEKVQSIESHLLTLRKTFRQLAAGTAIIEEESLYEKIASKATFMFLDFAVLLNLKIKQQGLPDADLLISEMDSTLHNIYRERRQSVKKEWQILNIIKEIIDVWEGSSSFSTEKSNTKSSLQVDIKSSLSILKLKENVEKSSTRNYVEVTKTLNDLGHEIEEISSRLHADKIPQLLLQMKQASVISGKYFYLALIFIASPLLINLLILPLFSETTATLFQPVILLTSFLSIMGVAFLLLYIQKILNV
jgi:hypothetical protein